MRAIAATVAATLACAVVAPTAFASSTFAHHVQLYSGGSYFGAPYVGSVVAVSVVSYGTAYSGTWISNSSGARVSADAYCNTPGCIVQIGWPGAKPSGYGTAHNHGNASPSYFEGLID
jgi:hypothetical protein